MEEKETRESALDVVLQMWSRWKWLAIVIFIWAAAAVVSTARFLPNLYRVTATVLVESQQVPETLVKSSVTSELETRIHTISQKLLSRESLEDFIKRFDLYPDVRKKVPLQAVIEHMRRDIHLELKKTQQAWGRLATIAFTVGYMGRDPWKVAAVTNAIASFYIEEDLRMRELQAVGTVEFLKAQLQEVKSTVDAQERRIAEFKLRHSGQLPDQIPVTLATLERLNAQLQLNNENQSRTLDRRDALLKKLAEEKPSPGDTGPDAMTARLGELKEDLARLRGHFSEKYPDVARVKAEIARVERRIAESQLDGAGEANSRLPAERTPGHLRRALDNVEEELKGLKAKERSLRQEIANYERRIENVPKREQALQELSQDYQARKERYGSLLKRYEEAKLAEDMEQRQRGEQFRILDSALPPKMPQAPNRFRLMLMGIALSLGIAAGASILADRLDTSFHAVDELRSFTKVPVVVGIPRIVTVADARKRRWRFCLGAAAAVMGLVAITGASYFIAHENENLVRLLIRGF